MDINQLDRSTFQKWYNFCVWARFYPDLFLDLIKPERGGITLHFDQRLYLRALMRFVNVYGVFPRSWGKTFLEVLANILACIFFPNIHPAISAQTEENAAKLLSDKTNEILKFWPLLQNEVKKMSFTKNDAKIVFYNGSTLDTLANAQSSKGQRRHRLTIEESALLNDTLYQDVLEPIPNIGRPTCGVSGVVDPSELNHQTNFCTTAGFRGTSEYDRSRKMIKQMNNLEGKLVIGAGWELGCWYGRGLTKSAILQRKEQLSTVFFAQNYESHWVGAADSALVSIIKLMASRVLEKPMLDNPNDEEIYLGVDVARSQSTANNQSSIAVLRVTRGLTGRVKYIDIVNTINVSNVNNFSSQALEVKRIKYRYNALMVVVDGNGLGSGLVDELLKETYDPITDETYPCWDTINTTNEPEDKNTAETCLYDLKAQGLQTKIITDFIDIVDSGKLRMLVTKRDNEFTDEEREDMQNTMLPYIQTDFLFAEIANLKLKTAANGNLQIEKSVSKMNKDRWSALAYGVFYIMEYHNSIESQEISDVDLLELYTYV